MRHQQRQADMPARSLECERAAMPLPGLAVGYCTISVTVWLSKIIPPVPGYDESMPIIYTRDQIASILGDAGP
jgi:hypothetical protein